MPLFSALLRSDAKLQACLVRDASHVTKGASGEHVGKKTVNSDADLPPVATGAGKTK